MPEMSDEEAAEGLKKYLSSIEDQSSRIHYFGETLSAGDIYDHVDKRTELGLRMIGMAKRTNAKSIKEFLEK